MSSQQTETGIDIALVNGTEVDASEVPHANQLMRFAEAVAERDEDKLESARKALVESAGPAVLVDAAGVAANFQRMVRIADSTGIPVDSFDNDLANRVREELDLYRFRSAQNSARGDKRSDHH